MNTDTTGKELINSEKIKESISSALDLFQKAPKTIQEVFLKHKTDLAGCYTEWLNEDSSVIKGDEKGNRLYVYGIVNAIAMTGDINSNFLLGKFIDNSESITEEEKAQLADALEKEISKQLIDMLLGLSQVSQALEHDSEAMKEFNNLATACSASNEIVKSSIMDKLEQALADISEKGIEGIHYTRTEDIQELVFSEMQYKWNTMMPPSSTIVDSMNKLIDGLVQSEDIKTNTEKKNDLLYALKFFNTLANNLPVLVRRKSNLLKLPAVYPNEASFFKGFARSALQRKTDDDLVKEVHEKYKAASKYTLLDRLKTLSYLERTLVIVLSLTAGIIIVSSMVYSLSSKDTVHQMFM
ncbi:hypothetical protein NEOKW01_0022 [Nematocida sp. AWRm80]|nr:hypothetical protein NEOKW01_0022 [Nematocida sp. AWRm80]